jgi:hypothetical protein
VRILKPIVPMLTLLAVVLAIFDSETFWKIVNLIFGFHPIVVISLALLVVLGILYFLANLPLGGYNENE